MRGSSIVVSCIVVAGLAMLLPVQAGSGPEVAQLDTLLLVGNKSEDTLSFIDVRTGKEIARTTTGRGPHEVAVSPDGQRAYVANYEGPGDSISVIDVPARKELRRIAIAPHRGPHGIIVSPDGKFVYATCERTRTVIEIDTASQRIVRSFPTEANTSHMLVLTPDRQRLYTANMRSGSVTAIGLKAGKILAQIPTGRGCEGIDMTPDGKEVWATNRSADTISIIGTRTNQVVATVPCPGFPIRIKVTPDGSRALVSLYRANAVAVFDVTSRKLIERISTGTGTAPVGILITPDSQRAYVANTDADRVQILDLETLKITGSFTAGDEPDGLALVVPTGRQ